MRKKRSGGFPPYDFIFQINGYADHVTYSYNPETKRYYRTNGVLYPPEEHKEPKQKANQQPQQQLMQQQQNPRAQQEGYQNENFTAQYNQGNMPQAQHYQQSQYQQQLQQNQRAQQEGYQIDNLSVPYISTYLFQGNIEEQQLPEDEFLPPQASTPPNQQLQFNSTGERDTEEEEEQNETTKTTQENSDNDNNRQKLFINVHDDINLFPDDEERPFWNR